MKDPNCSHFDGSIAQPRSNRCEECGEAESLRVCTTCGHVGCCESHKGHNTEHARLAGHPVIKSMPIDQDGFTWCYVCNRYLQTTPGASPAP